MGSNVRLTPTAKVFLAAGKTASEGGESRGEVLDKLFMPAGLVEGPIEIGLGSIDADPV